MALFVCCKFILQTHMRRHPEGLYVWFFIRLFIYFDTSCVRTAKALARLFGCEGSPEPSLIACDKYMYMYHDSFVVLILFNVWLYYTHTRDVIRYILCWLWLVVHTFKQEREHFDIIIQSILLLIKWAASWENLLHTHANNKRRRYSLRIRAILSAPLLFAN